MNNIGNNMAEVIGQDIAVSKEVSCQGCGARIRYYRNDVVTFQKTDYVGETEISAKVDCPQCKKMVFVPEWH